MKMMVKRFTARVVAVAMVLMTVASIGMAPGKSAKAAELSSYLNMEFGIKYTGQTVAKANSDQTAWEIGYFNVADSAYEVGDVFYVSGKISGASNFKQVAMQSSVNNWNWNAAPKKWSNDGTANDTVVAGKMVATQSGDNLSFKIQLDNLVNADNPSAEQDITLTDLYIMKVSKGSQEAEALPQDKIINPGTKYSGTVTANENEQSAGVYEAQYFYVNDTAYSEGDTYIISYTLGGATGFKQAVTQSSLNNWGWDDSVKVWAGNGLATAQDVTGAMTAVSSGDGVSFKVRLDSLVDASAEIGNSINLTLTDLVVVKVANDDTIALPSSKQISKDRKYEGTVNAVKEDTHWNVQYFNVTDSAFEEGDLVVINFKISGAEAFKQLAVQSNLNGWAWDSAPKIWKNNGIADDTSFSAVIKATETVDDDIAFKLWLDNPVNESFDESPVEITLNGLQVRDFEAVQSLNKAYYTDKGYFTVGAAVPANKMNNAEYRYRVAEVFGTITPENEMKPDALLNQKASQEAEDGKPVLNLANSGMTAILDFAKENNLKVRGHALIYAAQTPDWFFKVGYEDDGAWLDKDNEEDKAEMTVRMESYIKQVVEYVQTEYPGVVTCWDVVNEALDNDGNYVENNWTKTIGNDYVSMAFDYANQYVTDGAKLYYNDYNMESAGKQSAIQRLARRAHIDGVGMQEHVTLSYPTVQSIGSAIDFYEGRELDVQITELDVQIDDTQTFEEQAVRYADLFTLFKEKSSAISNVTIWGVNDGDSWKSAKRPLLFYDNLTPKPAYYAVLEVAKV